MISSDNEESSTMKDTLEQLGFTAYEADLYLCLLENGALSAYDLAERTGLYRQACYDALNRMREKGVVTQRRDGRRQLFAAASPEILLEQVREQESSLLAAMPGLLARQLTSQDKVSVEVFQGASVLNIAARDIIATLKRCGGENCATSSDEGLYLKLFGQNGRRVMEFYDREMHKHRFKERLIIKAGVCGLMPSTMSTYRCVPEKFFNPHPVQTYGDTVQIVLLGKPNSLIIIRSKDIADSFRKQFEMMWAMAKPLSAKR
jgi:predicted transcriptional regulator